MVLVGCRVTNKAGEAVIRVFERSAVNRPTFAIEPFSTPPHPDRSPQEFGDYRTCIYKYEPELRHALFCVTQGQHGTTPEGAHWVTPHEDAYQGGLLLVCRADGVVHAVCMHTGQTVHAFGANMGAGATVCEQGWDPHRRLLICGNIDGFARILYVAGGPHKAKQCMREAARRGERGGVLNVKHTWRAHTAMITQCKFAAPRGPAPACFITGAADGSVKMWTLEGVLMRELGMTGTDKIVKLASSKLVSRIRSKASWSATGSVDVQNTVISGEEIAAPVGSSSEGPKEPDADGSNGPGVNSPRKLARPPLTRAQSAHVSRGQSGFGAGLTVSSHKTTLPPPVIHGSISDKMLVITVRSGDGGEVDAQATGRRRRG